MPKILPSARFTDIQGWIPESDVDGIDVGTKFLSDSSNIDFENGFLQVAYAPTLSELPSAISTQISAGYSIVSAKFFNHSSQGLCTFYVLYKSLTEYKFFITTGAGVTGEVTINNIGSNPTISSAILASNISYGFINDQLKINLNVTATFFTIFTAKLNLSLSYLTAPPTTTMSGTGSAGWYLMIRWLGWQYNDISSILISDIVSATAATTLTEPCTDITPESWVSISAIKENADNTGWERDGTQIWGQITLGSSGGSVYLYNVKKLRINTLINSAFSDAIQVQVITAVDGVVFEQTNSDSFSGWLEYDLNFIGQITYGIVITITGNCNIYEIIVEGFTADEYCILGKYSDGQRALLSGGTGQIIPTLTLPVYLRTLGARIDYRLLGFEIYLKVNSLYYLVSEIPTTSGWSADAYGGAGWYKQLIVWTAYADLSTTLNFNYGLGSSVRADHQFTIYSETYYRNRTYAVNGDFRVYQSQIAGNAQHQPDSFPYSEADFYGFFELPHSESAQAVILSPLEELVVITLSKVYVYYMQIGQGAAYKRVRANNGTAGISYRKSLVKDINGASKGNIIVWVDNNGIYGYSGGIDAPVDLTVKANIKKWWLKATNDGIFNKDYTVATYYPAKNEIWFADSRVGYYQIILIYEINYGRFKKYLFPFTITEFLGIKNDKLYMLASTGNIYYYDGLSISSTSARLGATLATHYVTGYIATQFGSLHNIPEEEYKVLQEAFVMHKDVDTSRTFTSGTLTIGRQYIISNYVTGDDFTNIGATSNATGAEFTATGTTPTTWIHGSTIKEVCKWALYFNIDGNLVPSSALQMKNDILYDHIITPLGLQYHKIKLLLSTMTGVSEFRGTLREFGITLTTMDKGFNQ